MFNFSERSRAQLETCHPDLQTLANELIKVWNFTVVEGMRTTERQILMFKQGKSKLDGINKKSKHQARTCKECPEGCSFAFDIYPFPIEPNNMEQFKKQWKIVMPLAKKLLDSGKMKHALRAGIDWDSDGDTSDEKFIDAPHYELVTLKGE